MASTSAPIQETAAIEKEIMDKSIEFPLGIPGFSDCRRFVFTQNPEESPFAWMQSIEQPDLAFAVVEAYHLVQDYTVDINDAELEAIGNPAPQNCGVFFIVRLEFEKEKLVINTNLRAPVLINTQKRFGRQIVLPDRQEYSEFARFVY
jgi:flagellar assembly factor FliW